MDSRPTVYRTLRTWHAVAIGSSVGVVIVAIWWMLYSVDLLTFPPYDLGDLIIRRAPGDFATWSIETLGSRAQRTALTAGVFAWIAAFGAVGLAMRRFQIERSARFIPLALLPVALGLAWWSEGGPGIGRMTWLTLGFGLTLVAAGALLSFWMIRLEDATRESQFPTANWLDQPGDLQRREVLRQIALVTIGVGAGGAVVGRLLGHSTIAESSSSAGTPLVEARAELASPVALPTPEPAGPLPDTFEVPLGVRSRVTDNKEFYVVDISTRDPRLDELGWSLRVHGLVQRELLIGWPELLALPSVELDGTLMCISYEHDNGLISTTRWTGVRLRDVLDRAGIGEGTVDLICRGSNGYSDSIPLAKALEPTTLLAYGMNGTTLPRSHGFPCRLYVPGLYGEKNVKWLQEIELTDSDYQGYWQERGWTDVAVINTVSIIDTPRGTVLRDTDTISVGGIAFAGVRGIGAVQIRIDDGDWQEAVLEANDPPLIWQRWRFDWRPDQGNYRIIVRAIDGDGFPQTESERPPHPDGMTGLHTVSVDVV